jgi:hypothetical protein
MYRERPGAWIATTSLFTLLCLLPMAGVSAAGALPKPEQLLPFGAQRGTEVSVRVTGAELQDTTGLWFAEPAIQATLQTGGKADEQRFQVKVPASVAPGRYECRVVGKGGASEARFFVVGAFPEVTRIGERLTRQSPQPVQTPVVVNGSLGGNNDADWYRFPLKKGEWATLLCTGRSAGTKVDPYLRVLDPQGRSLAWNDDVGPNRDARIHFRAAQAGDYTIEVRDLQYRGGKAYDYRTTVLVGPYVTAASPAAIAPGGQGMVRLTVSGESRSVPVTAPAEFEWSGPGALVTADGAPDAYPLLASELPQVEEQAAHPTAAQAQPLSVPSGVTGAFGKIGEEDYYRVALREKQSLHVRVRMANWSGLGSPTIGVFAPDGKLLKFERGNGDGEAGYGFQAPAAGDYVICLRDLLWKVRGGPELGYYVEFFEQETPDFGLRYRDAATLYPLAVGSEAKLHLALDRRAFGGPVTLKVEGLPAGCTYSPTTFPGNGDFDLVIKCATASPAPYALLRISASAEINGVMRTRIARTAVKFATQDNDTMETAPEVTHAALNFGTP